MNEFEGKMKNKILFNTTLNDFDSNKIASECLKTSFLPIFIITSIQNRFNPIHRNYSHFVRCQFAYQLVVVCLNQSTLSQYLHDE
jgi:hypothetical protein